MRTLITGSCTAHRYQDMVDMMRAAELVGIVPTEIITGLSVGVDQLALEWAGANGIPTLTFASDYEKDGEFCHLVRHQRMVDEADAVIVLSHGSDTRFLQVVIDMARQRDLQLVVWGI